MDLILCTRYGWLEDDLAIKENIDRIWQSVQLTVNEVRIPLSFSGFYKQKACRESPNNIFQV
jgi:hypothetical protein